MANHYTIGLTKPSDTGKELLALPPDGVLKHSGFYIQFIKDIKKLVIDNLRIYFELNPKTVNYRWVGKIVNVSTGERDTDIECSKVHISNEYSDNVKLLPSVKIKSAGGRIRDLYLGQKLGTLIKENPEWTTNGSDDIPRYIEVGERVGGKVDLTVNLVVKSRSVVENDEVTDLTLLGLVGPIRREFYRENAVWLPDQGSVSNEAVEEETAQGKVFVRPMSFGLQVEWYDDFLYQAVTVEDIEGDPVYLTQIEIG